MPRRQLILISLASVLLVIVIYRQVFFPPSVQAHRPLFEVKSFAFSPDSFDPYRALEAQPTIIQPKYVSAKEGNEKLGPTELVLGVVVEGQARAYPINMLTGPRREIFNDRLGDQDIAATW